MINIEDLSKLNMRVGEIREVNDNNIKIVCGSKEFSTGLKLNVKKGDKIVISLTDKKIIIPVVNNNIPLSPERKIEAGSKVQ